MELNFTKNIVKIQLFLDKSVYLVKSENKHFSKYAFVSVGVLWSI